MYYYMTRPKARWERIRVVSLDQRASITLYINTKCRIMVNMHTWGKSKEGTLQGEEQKVESKWAQIVSQVMEKWCLVQI
jgi:hypothetical protein